MQEDWLKEVDGTPPEKCKRKPPFNEDSRLPSGHPLAWIHAEGGKLIAKAGKHGIPYPAFPMSDPYLSRGSWMVKVKWEGWPHREYDSIECSRCERIDLTTEGNTTRRRTRRQLNTPTESAAGKKDQPVREPRALVNKRPKVGTRTNTAVCMKRSRSPSSAAYEDIEVDCSQAAAYEDVEVDCSQAATVVTPEIARRSTTSFSKTKIVLNTEFDSTESDTDEVRRDMKASRLRLSLVRKRSKGIARDLSTSDRFYKINSSLKLLKEADISLEQLSADSSVDILDSGDPFEEREYRKPASTSPTKQSTRVGRRQEIARLGLTSVKTSQYRVACTMSIYCDFLMSQILLSK